jgi:hypothetical protein
MGSHTQTISKPRTRHPEGTSPEFPYERPDARYATGQTSARRAGRDPSSSLPEREHVESTGDFRGQSLGFDTPEAHGHASPYRPSLPKLGFSAEPGSGRLGDNRCECNAAFPSGTVTAPAYVRVRVCRTPGIFLLHISRRFELDLSPMALQGACVAGLA